MPELPDLPDLSNHPSPIIRKLSPHIVNLYNVIEIAIPEPERVESLQAMMRKAASDVIEKDDFGTFDAIIQAVSLAVSNTTNKR